MKRNQILYFIATIPDKTIRNEVVAFKKHIAAQYFSKAALTSPPHITLYPPFRWDESNEKIIETSLRDFSEKQQSFEIRLNEFACFMPRVIYIKPEKNNSLNILQSSLVDHLRLSINLSNPQNNRPYHPHMTIATRDLQKKYFYQAWEEFKNKEFIRDFLVKSIFLLKHNGKFWDIRNEYFFKL